MKLIDAKSNRKLILALKERILALEAKLLYSISNVDTSDWKNCEYWELGGC